MKYLTDLNTTILRADLLQNGFIDGVTVNTDLEADYNPTVGICLYGTDDMQHGTYSRGNDSYIPANHLDHNRSVRANVVFSPSSTGIECRPGALTGKILISNNLDAKGDASDPVRWCEIATVRDIPPMLDVTTSIYLKEQIIQEETIDAGDFEGESVKILVPIY